MPYHRSQSRGRHHERDREDYFYSSGHDEFNRRRDNYHTHTHTHPRYPKDMTVDRLGEFVVRRIIPALQRDSDRPITLFMNFGTLHVQDDYPQSDGVNHAVIYNAPGCTMVLGPGQQQPHAQQAGMRYGFGSPMVDVVGGPMGNVYSAGPTRGCSRCGMRRVLCFSGLCRDCESFEMGFRADRSIVGRRDDLSFVGIPERRVFVNTPSRW